ncbi:MAG: 6-carboxy-5,6,7,8-tetrahydropterin synthase [Alphaproteobacteria bacterium RIFCSPLOWO2_01_FULL_40_26]|nr:MAG: 6-carboxy-5,6,7,8-tetrahydropterin synthase [Alphaproteobacteria bacterium RIFCSPHIGHO2_02_FULL_40_34]OFW86383.1 MAG: 6-carboxy-5,6,7,8-tetrahydropterin synthase [Alphaproteobacteria bacterium RIFCSPHIGHO2_01_FULL_40_8]OFW94045.1 MAG: 6-carboxy-5,6,7,8-tetrahydropterin synthase [Alphaproteobacteria bacterium RIFCSPLOWO2_01_FULL_40_26]OFX09579.1 MAG: 6-carboxy-5,6,7,8-tetrahydropterin synthase [Alphaproteobacteria bacterium RIFCSPLOWO2_02_FULL_40_19]OFX12032.1 MAG: 6-carboxy-5,6,7,8-tetr
MGGSDDGFEFICTRRIEFDAAHRILNHESKCKMLHGHRYALEASFTAKKLDDLGRVIDFGTIREVLGSWVEEHLDHNTILSIKDKKLGGKISSETGQKIYYLKENPTAENIANHLLKEICPKLFAKKNVKCVAIKLYETPNCYVETK